MEELIRLDAYPIKGLIQRLLQDKTTRKNIMFASDSYAKYGAEFRDNSQMTENALLGFDSCSIQPRVYKTASEQTERTRKKAEVFTPAWIVNQMNNYCDEEWFGRSNVFNVENEDHTWTIRSEKIEFPRRKKWQQYVDSRRLEITCGEAPYIVSRYDMATGEIIPLEKRIGILDRKLRIVNENTSNEKDWILWALRAFQSVYGYEYQGDNLLIARINLLYTLSEYLEERWHRQATKKELQKFLNVICWNFWQMDGISNAPPYGIPEDILVQLSLFENSDEVTQKNYEYETIYCKTYDWRADISKLFKSHGEGSKSMKFDFLIGNPPYQQDSTGKKLSDSPLYANFMDLAYAVANCVELITPARFLFNAGNTPKEWNQKMLNDEHFKVLDYSVNSSKYFNSVDIKGGIAIHYRDATKNYGPIIHFTAFKELNSILRKVNALSKESITSIIYNQNYFNLTKLYEDFPELHSKISSNGKERRITSGCIEFPCFKDEAEEEYIKILGYNGKRIFKYIKRIYIDETYGNLNKYKVIVPANNGSGAIGEVLSTPLIGTPLIGYTQTFISFGCFEIREEADACLKYIKSKFARTMLGILKVTQNGKKPVWKYVPLQDFTPSSDINWSKSVHEIDLQLYRKYGLDEKEIEFIETHVKEME